MASFNLASKRVGVGALLVRSNWSSRIFVPVTRRHLQTTGSTTDPSAMETSSAAKQGMNEAMTGQDVKNMGTSAAAAAARVDDEVEETAGDISQTASEIKSKAKQTAQDAWKSVKNTKEEGGDISQTASEITSKAKQTAQEAWGSIKDTSQKIMDTVSGKAEEAKDFVKENAEKVERSMNSKDDRA